MMSSRQFPSLAHDYKGMLKLPFQYLIYKETLTIEATRFYRTFLLFMYVHYNLAVTVRNI